MRRGNDRTSPDDSYLSSRARQEAQAAVDASSLAATIAHVTLATAYARRRVEERAASQNSGSAE
ncbi:MAG TPA: hypothetical protein VNT25_00150 [Allosphingosinicella sp.]|nr:hypothetical protein [Allosphingosinicella sp.]